MSRNERKGEIQKMVKESKNVDTVRERERERAKV